LHQNSAFCAQNGRGNNLKRGQNRVCETFHKLFLKKMKISFETGFSGLNRFSLFEGFRR
jgi:hypothetical protein